MLPCNYMTTALLTSYTGPPPKLVQNMPSLPAPHMIPPASHRLPSRSRTHPAGSCAPILITSAHVARLLWWRQLILARTKLHSGWGASPTPSTSSMASPALPLSPMAGLTILGRLQSSLNIGQLTETANVYDPERG